MPLYEYKCEDCGSTQVLLEKVSDDMERECPHCGGRAKRQISAPALHFKGTGWYVTDYGRGSGVPASSPPAKDKEKEKSESTGATAEPKAPTGTEKTEKK